MLGRLEPFEIFRQQALPVGGGVTRMTTQFPLGKPYHYLDLFLEVSLLGGAGAATGPIAEGLLNYVKSINFFTPKNEYIYQNVPGRLAYILTCEGFDYGAARLDVPADPGNGVTSVKGVLLRINLNDLNVFDPSDFILDSMGYSNMNFDISVGTISDLFGTVNNCTISASQLTAVLWQEPAPLVYQQPKTAEAQAKKNTQVGKWYQSHLVCGFGDPTALSFLDMPRSADIAYQKLWAWHGEPTVIGGQPFSGAADNIGARYTDFSLQTDTNFPIKNIRAVMLRDAWQSRFSAFNAQFKPNSYLGIAMSPRGQKQAALYSGDKSLLRLTWTLPASGQASASSQLAIGAKVWRLKAS